MHPSMATGIPFPDIDPALLRLELFGVEFALRWYALAYVAGLVLGALLVARLMARPALWGGTAPMPPRRVEDLLTWMVIGVILGGRLGFVLFYQPAYYLAHPAEILAVWKGGMSFHGGFLGVVAAVVGFAARNGYDPVRIGDAVAVAAPIGLFFGRLANFVNAELWGRPTTVPWGMVFPGADCPAPWPLDCARHPSQLYQAGLEGLALGLVLLIAVRGGALAVRGRATALFLTGYGAARLLGEAFRQPDAQFVTPSNPLGLALRLGPEVGLTMGQLLSLPMLLAGLALLALTARRA